MKGMGKGKQCMTKMDADGDGNISKEEFMKGHEVKFDQIDANSDGVIDASERAAHMQHKKGKGKGKCGGSS
jgi:Ca2+-binding EF-hand superfamily protein